MNLVFVLDMQRKNDYLRLRSVLSYNNERYIETDKRYVNVIDWTEYNLKTTYFVVFGTIQFVSCLNSSVYRIKNKVPQEVKFVFFGWNNKNCVDYYPFLKETDKIGILNKTHFYMTWAQFKQPKSKINKNAICYNNPTFKDSFFIRPNSGLKPFPGQCFPLDATDSYVENAIIMQELYNIADNELIFIAPQAKNKILTEIRCVVDHNHFITGSSYSWDSSNNDNERQITTHYDDPFEIIDPINTFLTENRDNFPERYENDIFCCDIAITDNKKTPLQFIEFNSLCSAGLYNCYIPKIIDSCYKTLREEQP